MRDWLRYFNRLVAIPMSDLSAGTGESLLSIGGHQVGVSICYEAAFGADLASTDAPPAYLLYVSNDSWFGDSLAPHQHLQIARLRAAESGRMMVRSTSTGISAIIDYNGQIVSHLSIGEQAILRGTIRLRRGETFYMRWHDRPVLITAVLALLISFFWCKRERCSDEAGIDSRRA